MFKRLMLHSIIIAIIPMFILSNAAGVGLNSQIKSVEDTAVTEDTWRPLIKSHSWLAAPTALTPILTARPTTPFGQYLNTRGQLTRHTGKYNINNNNNTDTSLHQKNMRRQGGGNNDNDLKKISTSSTIYRNPQQTSSISANKSLESIKNFQSNAHIHPFYMNINSSRTGSNKSISDTHHYHHLLQAFATNIKHNKTETEHPSINKSKYVTSQVQDYQNSSPLPTHNAKNRKYSTPTQFNLNRLANRAESRGPTNYSTPTSDNIKYDRIDENNFGAINFQVKRNSENDNILSTTLNGSINNENIIDNEIINGRNHHHHQLHYQALSNDSVNGKLDRLTTSLAAANTEAEAPAYNKEDIHRDTLRRETFKNIKGIYDTIEDNVLGGKHKRSGKRDRHDNIVEADDYEDATYDDGNDLQKRNSSSHQVFKDTSTAVAAAIEATVKKLDSLNVKNLLLSWAPADEIKGRRRQIDKGHTKYISIKSPSQAAGLLASSFQDTNETQNKTHKLPFQSAARSNDTKAKTRLQNLSNNIEIISSAVPSLSKKPPASTLLKADTSKGLAPLGSGRKIKKLKKKFEKFLLPLVMAYKLKFMVLIPVLIGGLVLLVGSTGLAGFFFALFTAVMSLKSDHGNAILVKKH